VVNAASAKVTGLKGLTYMDKSADPNNPAKKVEDREAVGFGTALVDSVYMDAPSTVDLEVGGWGGWGVGVTGLVCWGWGWCGPESA
jgi:glucose-6-phosphate 1-epimerase